MCFVRLQIRLAKPTRDTAALEKIALCFFLIYKQPSRQLPIYWALPCDKHWHYLQMTCIIYKDWPGYSSTRAFILPSLKQQTTSEFRQCHQHLQVLNGYNVRFSFTLFCSFIIQCWLLAHPGDNMSGVPLGLLMKQQNENNWNVIVALSWPCASTSNQNYGWLAQI